MEDDVGKAIEAALMNSRAGPSVALDGSRMDGRQEEALKQTPLVTSEQYRPRAKTSASDTHWPEETLKGAVKPISEDSEPY